MQEGLLVIPSGYANCRIAGTACLFIKHYIMAPYGGCQSFVYVILWTGKFTIIEYSACKMRLYQVLVHMQF